MLLRQSLTALVVALSPFMLPLDASADQDTYVPPDSTDSSDAGPSGPTCLGDGDCHIEQTCVDGVCKSPPQCPDEFQCSAGLNCLDGKCWEQGYACREDSHCNAYSTCVIIGGDNGWCTIDSSVPAYAPCEAACTQAASCLSETQADCELFCNYSAVNGGTTAIDALVACSAGKQCDQIKTDCDVGHNSVLQPLAALPTTVPSHELTGNEDASGPSDTSSTAKKSSDASGCASSRAGQSVPLSLALTLLAFVALARTRERTAESR